MLLLLARSAHLRAEAELAGQPAAGRRPVPWLHFMSFGDEQYTGACQRIADQARRTGVFPPENIRVFREVPPDIWFDPKWEWHRQVHRGHGYWFWKSAMVRRLLEKTVPKGEVLVYADAGCEFGLTKMAIELWEPLLARAKENDLVAFSLSHKEAQYTKGDIFATFDVNATDRHYAETAQVAATYFLIRNTPAARAFVAKWEQLCTEPVGSDRKLISDYASQPQHPDNRQFLTNRHDESLFSMLVKANKPVVQPCKLYSPKFPYTTDEVRNRRWGVSGMKIELFPDLGYPTSPCSPLSTKRNPSGFADETAECKQLPPRLQCIAMSEDALPAATPL